MLLSSLCHSEDEIRRISFSGLLRRVAPRNDVKCAALSLAALNDFVSKANKTSVHLVKAMPQAAQRYSVVPQAHNMYYVTVQQLREIISVTT